MIREMLTTLAILLAAVAFAACGAAPQPPTAAPANIVAENSATGLAVADAVLNITTVNGAAYLTLINRGDAPERLLAVDSAVARSVELHETVMDGNMMQMHPIDSLEIPAGATVKLEPGSYHIMLIDVTQNMAAGDTVNLTLTFEKSGEIVVPARVQQAAGMAPGGADHAADSHNMAATSDLAPVALAAGQKLKVLATTTIVADLVRQVGGDAIELATLLPVGSDPHSFEPSPQDIAAASNAQAIFANGLGLEQFLLRLVESAGGQQPVISVAEGVPPREMMDAHDHQEDDAADTHGHDGADPHVWVSPANALIMVENIGRSLSALDPANAEIYQANASRYAAELTELDAWVQTQINTIPPENRKMVTDHNTFGYFADRYGLEIIGAVIPSFSTNAEPSAQEMAQLLDAIHSLGVKAVFVGATVNPTLAGQVAADSGIKLISLHTGSLGGPGSGAESYVDYIRANTSAITEGLK